MMDIGNCGTNNMQQGSIFKRYLKLSIETTNAVATSDAAAPRWLINDGYNEQLMHVCCRYMAVTDVHSICK